MERIRKVGTTLRNNWKKSVFFTLVGGYGAKWYDKKLKDEAFMRELAREALSYGSTTIQGTNTPNYCVTVILNPVASGGKGRKLYEKYCAPLLHLAGMKVSVIRTESDGQAKDIMEIMTDAEAVLVAGGDGTLMETVTGLLRRKDKELAVKVPLGILPVGKTNTLAHQLFNTDDSVRLMGEATMSVVRQLRRQVGVIEVENKSEDEIMRGKKLYCLNKVELGGWKDARLRADRYWLFGFGLKNYVTYAGSYLTGHKEVLWDCDMDLQYMGPVDTEVENVDDNVNSDQTKGGGWLSWLSGRGKDAVKSESYKEVNKELKNFGKFNGTQITIEKDEDDLKASLFKGGVSLFEFVNYGWSQLNKQPSSIGVKILETDKLYLNPNLKEGEERKMCMDGDEIEMNGPVLVSLVKDQISLFCDKSQAVVEEKPSSQTSPKRWSGISSTLVKQRTL